MVVTPNPHQSKLLAKLALTLLLVAALALSSLWFIRSFLHTEPKTIVLSPQDTAAMTHAAPAHRQTTTPPNLATMNAPVFTGKVIDAKTKQPILRLLVRIGSAYGARQPDFSGHTFVNFNGGTYRIAAPYSGGPQVQWCLRVEARGYLPALSPLLRRSGAHDFALQPGPDIDGVVLAPDGSPAANPRLFMSIPGIQAYIDTNSASQDTNGLQTTSDSHGHYTFNPQLGPVALAAYNDQGYGELRQNAPASDWTIHLLPWAQIQGQLTVAGKPAPQSEIRAMRVADYDLAKPVLNIDAETQTDALGHFLLPRVVPGPQQIGRDLPQKTAQYTNYILTQTVDRTLLPGQSLTVNLGGRGRPVIGRLVLPGPSGNFSAYNISQNITGAEEPPPPPQMPDKVKSASLGARQLWMSVFQITPAGRQYFADHPESRPQTHNYAMTLSSNGNFRIDDVIPGDYSVWVYVASNSGGFRNSSNTFTMPTVPQGYSADPLDIGVVKLSRR